LLVSSLHLQLCHQVGSIGLDCIQLSCSNSENIGLDMPKDMQNAWHICIDMQTDQSCISVSDACTEWDAFLRMRESINMSAVRVSFNGQGATTTVKTSSKSVLLQQPDVSGCGELPAAAVSELDTSKNRMMRKRLLRTIRPHIMPSVQGVLQLSDQPHLRRMLRQS